VALLEPIDTANRSFDDINVSSFSLLRIQCLLISCRLLGATAVGRSPSARLIVRSVKINGW
jgi:hypothetical protein